jgi:hypothetical protein
VTVFVNYQAISRQLSAKRLRALDQHPVYVEPPLSRHPRESGDPGASDVPVALGSRFRGNDDVKKCRYHSLEILL